MSSTKEYLFSIQEQQADEWFSERLSDDTLDEDSDEYQQLEVFEDTEVLY